MVTHNPLHRSRRAALPHRAPTLGDDGEADPGIRMTDTRGRKPAIHITSESLPWEAVLLAAASERATPKPPDLLPEDAESPAIQRHAVVAHVPHHDRAQVGALLWDSLVQASPELLLHFCELGLHALSHRLSKHDEFSSTRLAAAVRETEEVEGLGLRTPTVAPVRFGISAERNQAGLVGVQLQAKPCKPLTQLDEELLGLLTMLESNDEVVGEARDHDISVRLLLSPPLDPEVEHIMEINVGQERA
jgi:hypothetical protein